MSDYIKCGVCKASYTAASFHKDPSRKNGLSRRCKTCEQRRTAKRAQGRLRDRQEIVLRLKGKPCADCGNTYPYYVMDFDHRPGEEKLFNLSRWQSYGILALMDEAAKCDVVCSNCHRIRTHERLSLPVLTEDDN